MMGRMIYQGQERFEGEILLCALWELQKENGNGLGLP